ncbi:MAG: hypothetical protein SFV22_18315, partial [Saprospiraceae bacterium]|nr:hypothetical protein [Saprospiraceae bacterium]
MKRTTLHIFLSVLPLLSFAQKHDYVWIVGDNNSLTDSTRGGSVINFDSSPPNVYYNYRELNMFSSNSSVCNINGILQFYSNGCDVAGIDDTLLENGEDINPGTAHQIKCDQENDGYAGGYQSMLTLPLPEDSNVYYLFHKRVSITFNPVEVKTDRLFYSRIDMSQNFGRGSVMEKNVSVMSGDISYGELTAVKHANGKDWWLVTPKRNSNEFYIFRFTKEGIVDTVV